MAEEDSETTHVSSEIPNQVRNDIDQAKNDTGTNKGGMKNLSKLGMVLATVFVVAGSVLKWLGVFKDAEIDEVLKVGGGLVLFWTPGFVSIWLDKIAGIAAKKIGSEALQ